MFLYSTCSNRLAVKGGGFLGVAGGNWGRPGAPPAIGRSTYPRQHRPKISAFFNMAFTSSKSSTVRTQDLRTSWAPRRNNMKASAPSFEEPLLSSSPSFGEWVSLSTTITRQSLLRSRVLILKELRNLLPSFMFRSVNYAAKLVHTRRAYYC